MKLKKLLAISSTLATCAFIPAMVTSCNPTNSINSTKKVTANKDTVTVGDFDVEIIDERTARLTTYLGKNNEVDIPASVRIKGHENPYIITEIGMDCFASSNIQNITFSEASQITTIDDCAFANCKNLRHINNLPKTIKHIGNDAFHNCENLNSDQLTISELVNLESISDGAFSGTYIGNVVIPRNVKSIGKRAFANCKNLSSVNLQNNLLTHIGDLAFANDESLMNVHFSNRITEMGDYVFENCPLRRVDFSSFAHVPTYTEGWQNHAFEGIDNSVPLCTFYYRSSDNHFTDDFMALLISKGLERKFFEYTKWEEVAGKLNLSNNGKDYREYVGDSESIQPVKEYNQYIYGQIKDSTSSGYFEQPLVSMDGIEVVDNKVWEKASLHIVNSKWTNGLRLVNAPLKLEVLVPANSGVKVDLKASGKQTISSKRSIFGCEYASRVTAWFNALPVLPDDHVLHGYCEDPSEPIWQGIPFDWEACKRSQSSIEDVIVTEKDCIFPNVKLFNYENEPKLMPLYINTCWEVDHSYINPDFKSSLDLSFQWNVDEIKK